MKFFADTRPRRLAAFKVPKAWRFAAGSSAASVSLLEKREPHSGAAKNSPATTSQAPAEWRARPDTEGGCPEDDADGIKESCLNACDDGWRILPKVYLAADLINPGPALPGAALRTASQHLIGDHV